ncbi:MAG: RpiB/LacA/LacB family sugar-phosphate isomerase [Spirochaetota bacterium]
MDKLTIALASDLSGFPLKEAVVEYLNGLDHVTVVDYGIESADAPQPYTAQAPKVAEAVQNGSADRGILVCGTGQGMAIVANKYKGVYAVVADSIFSAERGKIINNANVLTMGGWITAPFLGVQIVEAWLGVAFTEKMEHKKDFLTKNFNIVKDIEEKNFR